MLTLEMNEDFTLNISEICRLCLSKEGEMLPIFDSKNGHQSPPLPVKIMTCVSIKVVADDGLPNIICHQCALHINSWYQFKKKCQSSEATLKRYISRHQSDSESNGAEEIRSPSPLPEQPTIRRRPKSKYRRTCRRPKIAEKEAASVSTVKENTSAGREDIEDLTDCSVKEVPVYPVSPDEVKVEVKCEVKLEDEEKEQLNVRDNNLEYFPPITITKGFPCPVCSRSFSSKSYLRDHQAVHSGDRSFTCSECGKSFYSVRKLALHIKTHSAERPCLCSVCGKAFREKSDLKKHFRLHSDESPFLCNVCGKTFKTKFYLTRHLIIHSGEKRHTCTECGKAFTWRDTLMAHAKVHAEERPLPCTVCNKGFKRKEDLVRHMRIHTGEKPFICPYCTRRFSDKWNLTQHIRLHTGQKPYVCSVCSQAFTHNVTLRNHMKQQHSTN